ncbi:MAG TPA: uroporphyrinogen decarboxylase family protein [Dehalococcoidia bacterium]|nr:uroporphyrinogen decarboxylase family protein [Dehalococcoidia bacterium]
MPPLSRLDRVEAALAGESLDRVPISLWGHDFRREWSAHDLVAATLEQVDRYGWDYVKITPRVSYCVEDWGARYLPSGQPDVPTRLAETPIRVASDLENLDLLRFDRGALEEQLQVVRLIGRALGRGTPYLQTIPAPLVVLDLLVGDRPKLIEWLESDPRHVRTAIEAIGETYLAYARETIAAGASGIFFSTGTWASSDTVAEAVYEEFGAPADRRVLAAVGDARCNVLHLGGSGAYLGLAGGYPVRAICWAASAAGNPALDEARDQLKDGSALMGGLPAALVADGAPADVERAVREAVERTDRYRLLIGPEADLPERTPHENRLAAAEAARRI